jgi:single-stranded DNA-binding protein
MNANQAPVDSAYLTIIGTATADATIAVTKNNKEYARIQVKVISRQETTWLGVICFDTDTVESAKRVRKDSRVDVGGRLQIREYTANDGQKRTSVGIVAQAIAFISQPVTDEYDPFEDAPF